MTTSINLVASYVGRELAGQLVLPENCELNVVGRDAETLWVAITEKASDDFFDCLGRTVVECEHTITMATDLDAVVEELRLVLVESTVAQPVEIC